MFFNLYLLIGKTLTLQKIKEGKTRHSLGHSPLYYSKGVELIVKKVRGIFSVFFFQLQRENKLKFKQAKVPPKLIFFFDVKILNVTLITSTPIILSNFIYKLSKSHNRLLKKLIYLTYAYENIYIEKSQSIKCI